MTSPDASAVGARRVSSRVRGSREDGTMSQPQEQPKGGRYDFEDGGTYCGGWFEEKAHGHGVCTGPKSQGEFSGAWVNGYEVSGVYTWPSGSTYDGQWHEGKRHGLGVETRGRWMYRGDWHQGFKGRYGVRQSLTSLAKYEGTWQNGLQDGYGAETYADGGTYQGQWAKGMRQGFGVRSSAPFGLASHARNKQVQDSNAQIDQFPEDGRGGFVLKGRSEDTRPEKRSLMQRLKKQRSTSDLEKRGTALSVRSTGSSGLSSASSESAQSAFTESNLSFVSQDEVTDSKVIESYMGEWKMDKRNGFGICERSDGLKYEGEWHNNKKFGYGITTFKDGTQEMGKYKNNVLVTSGKRKHLFLLRSVKFRERVEAAAQAAVRTSQTALQKSDIAISRQSTAREKGEMADVAALHAREDSDIARVVAKEFAPQFVQPGLEALRLRKSESRDLSPELGKVRIVRQDFTPTFRSRAAFLRNASREGNLSTLSPSSCNHFKERVEVHFPPNCSSPLPPSPNPPNPGRMSPPRPNRKQLSQCLQQVMEDHLDHYSGIRKVAASPPIANSRLPRHVPIEPVEEDYYGTQEDGMDPRSSCRRSTLPNVLPVVSANAAGPSAPKPKPRIVSRSPELGRRKKSLPDLTDETQAAITREEAAALSTLRRDAIRKEIEEQEKLRANPFLYLLSSDLREWLSRQQLIMLVLFINISLAIMFFKLLT